MKNEETLNAIAHLALANELIEKLNKEKANLKKDHIKSLREYKSYFEGNWDYDKDLLSADRERDHYRWVIVKLRDLGKKSWPNYIDQIDEHESKLPF